MNIENTVASTTTSSHELTIDNDLVLRDLTMEDAPAIYHIVENTREYLRKWLPFIGYSDSVSDAEEFITSVTGNKQSQDIVFTVNYQDEIVGIIGFKNINRLNYRLEIAYWLNEEYRGKGITSRATAKLVEFAFTKLRMNRVQVKVPVDNETSKRIPQKLGFVLEGIERDGECIEHSFVDLEIYSLLKRDWLQMQENNADAS